MFQKKPETFEYLPPVFRLFVFEKNQNPNFAGNHRLICGK